MKFQEFRAGMGRAVITLMTRRSQVRLLRKIGRGASATVWAGHHEALGRQVAVKRVSAQRLRDRPDEAARLGREARIGASLRSPHAVRVIAQARRPEATYLVMEWLEGETLEERLRRCGPLSVPEVVELLRQVAAVLAEAHGLGIVHRDIKPSNLFLVADPAGPLFVKVLDFGIAALRSEDEPATSPWSAVLGSPVYMSPERFAGEAERDPRTDLWSLAVVAYRALTGERPFEGATVGDLAYAVCCGEAVAPRRLRPELPPEIDVWFARAFARDIACRFQTPAELAAAFAIAAAPRAEATVPERSPSSDDELTSVAIEVDWATGLDTELERTRRLQRHPTQPTPRTTSQTTRCDGRSGVRKSPAAWRAFPSTSRVATMAG